MLSYQGILDFLNDTNRKCEERIIRWRNVYFDMSLHVDGACPAYQDLSSPNKSCWVFPTNYFGRDYQWIFENRLYSKHPRESKDQRNWRLSQHRPFTQQPFLQVIQVLMGAIFQDSNYSIDIENKDDADYIWGNNFEGKNLVGYISEKFQNICVDPNGVFVVIPKEPYYKTTTERIEPKVVWIPSRFIERRTEDEIIFAYDSYMWCANIYGIFRYEQRKNAKGEDQWVSVDGVTRGYYGHMLMRAPNHVGGGIWNTQGFYESWLHSAKAWADEFVSNKSAEQLVNKEASHPYIIEPAEDCPSCEGGQVVSCLTCRHPSDSCTCSPEQADMKAHKCSACGGTAKVSRNPGDHLSVDMDDLKDTGANDLIKFISPDIKINDFHAKNNTAIFQELYRALYLNYIDKAQSAVAKDRDMEARYQFILAISNDLFDRLLTGLIKDILSMRNVRVENEKLVPYSGEFEIVKPTEFKIKSSYDLLLEYDLAYKSKLPDFVLAKQLRDFNDKQFGGDDALKRKTAFIIQRDPIAVKDDEMRQIALSAGAITQKDWFFSINLPTILDTVIRTYSKEWFIRAEYDEINTAVETIFNAMEMPQAPTDVKIIDQNKV